MLDQLAHRRDACEGPRLVGLPLQGRRQAREHHRPLSLTDAQHGSGQALPRQGAERPEGLGEAQGHQHRQGANLRCRLGRAEAGGQVPGGDAASAGQVSEQRHRGRSRQAEAADPADPRLLDVEDGLCDDQGLRGDACVAQGAASAFNISCDIRGEVRIVERAFCLGTSALAEATQFVSARLEPKVA